MIRINLLPKDYRERKKSSAVRLLVSLALGSLGAVVVVILVCMYISAVFKLKNLETERSKYEADINTLSSTVQRVKELEQIRGELAAKTSYQQQLVGQKVFWSSILSDFSQLVPDGVWIENMEIDDLGNLKIHGTTFTYESVAEFMVKLKSTGRFGNIDFATAQADKIGQEKVVKFDLTAQLNKGSEKS